MDYIIFGMFLVPTIILSLAAIVIFGVSKIRLKRFDNHGAQIVGEARHEAKRKGKVS